MGSSRAARFLAAAAGLAAIASGLYLGFDRETGPLDDQARRRSGAGFAPLEDGLTAYRDTGPGSGPAVVLIHGATVGGFFWRRQVEPLAAAGLRVISYDMYGRGHSDRPRVSYDRALFERQLLGLLDHLEIREPVRLVGHSFGGATAVRFAARHPARVERLALIAPVVDGVARRAPFVLAGMPGLGRFLTRVMISPALPRRIRGQLACCPEDAARIERRFREQMTWSGYERAVRSLLTSDAIGDYREDYLAVGRRGTPVLILRGSLDPEITAEAIAEAIDLLGPGARLSVLEGVGHSPNIEAADEVNVALIDFLTGG